MSKFLKTEVESFIAHTPEGDIEVKAGEPLDALPAEILADLETAGLVDDPEGDTVSSPEPEEAEA